MAKALLLGYFGAGNFGDDALLVDWLTRRSKWLSDRGLGIDIITNGGNPLDTFIEGQRVAGLVNEWIDKRKALKLNPAAYEALIAPGGSLLQDVTSVRSLVYYLLMIRKFCRARRKVMLLNQGIGPLNSWLASFFTPRVLAHTTMLSLRDSESHRWACSQGPLRRHRARILSADPVLNAQFGRTEFRDQLDLPRDYAAVIAKPTGDLPTPVDPVPEARALAALISHSARTTGLTHCLLALHPGRDLEFCRQVAQECEEQVIVLSLAELDYSSTVCHSVIAEAEFVISYRLHGLVSAAAAGKLSFGVAYDPKVAAFCTELAIPYCYPATVHEEQAGIDLARLWRERDEAGQVTATAVSELRKRHQAAEDKFDQIWG